MRITIGVKSLKEADYFLRNGADEVYLSGRMNKIHDHNSSFSGEKEVADCVRLARRMKKSSMLALNEIYPREDYPFLLDQARRLTDRGLDGIIVYDPSLLEYFRRRKFSTYFVSSVVCACFNSQAMAYYRDLGVRRFTLHSQILPEDAVRMVGPSLKTETVIFPPVIFWASNILPYCFFHPRRSERPPGGESCPHACAFIYDCAGAPFQPPQTNLYFQAGLLYDFHKMGVNWLKVPRQLNSRKLLAEFKMTVYLRQLLEKKLERKIFVEAAAKLTDRADINKYGHSYSFKPFTGA